MKAIFRTLNADEIDCRVAQIYEKNSTCSLLLYKDARCDMNILDETVGPYNWQREHVLIDGQLFCRVGICENAENWRGFVWKEDVGTESYTEAEKGRASDSFKRACFNWGIGRELYTAPKIIVPCKLVERNGKKTTYDRFEVAEIGYDENRRISRLRITRDGETVYKFNSEAQTSKPDDTHIKALLSLMEKKGVSREAVEARYGAIEEMDMATYTKACQALDKS